MFQVLENVDLHYFVYNNLFSISNFIIDQFFIKKSLKKQKIFLEKAKDQIFKRIKIADTVQRIKIVKKNFFKMSRTHNWTATRQSILIAVFLAYFVPI